MMETRQTDGWKDGPADRHVFIIATLYRDSEKTMRYTKKHNSRQRQ